MKRAHSEGLFAQPSSWLQFSMQPAEGRADPHNHRGKAPSDSNAHSRREDEPLKRCFITFPTHPPRALGCHSVPVPQNPSVPYKASFFSFVERVLY